MSSRVAFVLAFLLSLGPIALSLAQVRPPAGPQTAPKAASPASPQVGQQQASPPNVDRLAKLLREKFMPSPERRRKGHHDRREFDWITARFPARHINQPLYRGTTPAPRPDVVASKPPPPPPVPATQPQSPAAKSPPAQSPPAQSPPAQSPPVQSPPAQSPSAQLPPVQSAPAPSRSVPPPQQPAQAGVPLVRHNSYVIMLKPDTTETQVNALLQKYNLTIAKLVPSLHLLRVQSNDAPATADATPAQGSNDAIARLLTPKLISDLRKEPTVESAFVESALTAHSIPQAKTTAVVSDSVTYNWHWKDGLLTPTAAPSQPQLLDGNWGLKAMRLPTAWTILERYRATHPNQPKPKLAFIDSGFSNHEDLAFNALRSPDGVSAPNVAVTSSVSVTGNMCELAHGNHVAGIAGAIWGNGVGIDGVVPQAKIDAVPFSSADSIDDTDLNEVAWEQRTSLFMDVLEDLSDYLDDSDVHPDGLRVINLSLGYNFIADGVFQGDPNQIPDLKEHIAEEALPFAHLMQRYQNSVLFVTSAGNDSQGAATPYDTKWSSPITWAATQTPAASRPTNVLVVEAVDRNGLRADFSNIGGDVSAPGVNILSTLWSGENAYGVCSGTSQASPHVAALATLLFELDPTKAPADIVNIIKSSATKQASGPGAPEVDALEAVLRLSPDNLTRLADLNGDGKVDALDLAVFAKQIIAINNNRKGTPFADDLNGDGVVDANECSWPLIDLNGSGIASLSSSDARSIQGSMRTDLQVMQLAWTDKSKDFNSALHDTGLDTMITAVNASPASSPGTGCR
jgi:hypothetical protein